MMLTDDDIDALTDQKVGVVYGGASRERPISLETGHALADALGAFGLDDVAEYDVPDDLERMVDEQPDRVLLALHGGAGEDGTLQGFLEVHGIAYTGSGVAASALAMDKWRSKAVFGQAGLTTPNGAEIRGDQVDAWDADAPPGGWGWFLNERDLGPPTVVKPVDDGSSVGITMCDTPAEVGRRVTELLAEQDRGRLLIEQRIDGAEYTVGLFNGESMGALEVEPSEAFYDYTAKYESSGTEYAPIEAGAWLDKLEAAGRQAYQALGCSGVARVDFIGRPSGGGESLSQLVTLEVNTIPGMTESSLVPKLAARQGLEFPEFAAAMLANASLRSDFRREVDAESL
jgi:D-alanine-D-alanine ligase